MAEYGGEKQTTAARVSDPAHGHERSDVTLAPLLKIAALLVVVAVLVHVILWGVMGWFERDERRTDPLPSPVLAARAAPAEPRLQPTMDHHDKLPWEDVKRLREESARTLSTYGWIDREQGIVRLPIEQAMEKLLRQSQTPATRGAP